jgi:hypothetical protein
MMSTIAWNVVVESGSHCCMMMVRRFRVSLDLRSRGDTRIPKALTILVTASGLLSSAESSSRYSLVPHDSFVHSP